jgi:hypothetical protein
MTGQAMNGGSGPAGYERCGGKTRSGKPCKLPAGHGTSHQGTGRCDHHGGATPNHVKHAERVLAEQACAKFGLPIETSARDALTAELHRTAGVVAYLMARVAELDDMTWGTARRVVKTGTPGAPGTPSVEVHQAAGLHPLVGWLERERRHLAALAADMERLGIETRQARMAELLGGQILSVLEAYAAELGHNPRDLGVRAAAARVLALAPGWQSQGGAA